MSNHGSKHWYIRSYVGGNLIRNQGFSTRKKALDALTIVYPKIEGLLRFPKGSEGSWNVAVLMSCQSHSKRHKVYIVIEKYGSTATAYFPETPLVFEGGAPTRSAIFRSLNTQPYATLHQEDVMRELIIRTGYDIIKKMEETEL